MQALNIGVIGAGGNARGHGKRLRQLDGVSVTALADPSEGSLTRFVDDVFVDQPAPATYSDHKRMLETEKLDAVLISSPHTMHFRQIMDALDARLHVLCEKPMVCSEAEAQQVIARAAEVNRHVVVSYQRRFNRQYRFMKDFIHSPEFGRRYYFAAFLSQGWLKAQTGKWRQDPALSGGGQLHDSGSHIVDMMTWLLDDPIAQVAAVIHNRGTQVDVDSAITFQTRGGTMGTLSIVGSGPTKCFWEDMTIAGETGYSLFMRKGALMATHGHGAELIPVEDFSTHGGTSPDAHFVDVIRGRARNESPPEAFLEVIRFTQACWDSAAKGGAPVSVG
ncbi:MAG: Gfo/Idh/MocA family oxidoreductase [Kiritimatiellae bacterium]|nr:Gfo/Idh/MocA family oxidoreductase [Kiritimatiellia bacterium]